MYPTYGSTIACNYACTRRRRPGRRLCLGRGAASRLIVALSCL